MIEDRTELYLTNDDILYILNVSEKIAWTKIKPQNLYRIIYLSKVLYSFVNREEPNLFDNYHFSTTIYGPYSSSIEKSLIFLESNTFIVNKDGGFKIVSGGFEKSENIDEIKRESWFDTIILLLGKYGENKIFSFTINDPLYQKSVEVNTQKEINFNDDENKTLKVLESFKSAFEATLSDVSSISKEEYLELYFDYIFSQIIK